jgi:hypothetical protein
LHDFLIFSLTGHSPAIYRPFTGHSPAIHRPFTGHSPAIYRPFTGHSPAIWPFLHPRPPCVHFCGHLAFFAPATPLCPFLPPSGTLQYIFPQTCFSIRGSDIHMIYNPVLSLDLATDPQGCLRRQYRKLST